MSDITAKIISIEPDDGSASEPKIEKSDVLSSHRDPQDRVQPSWQDNSLAAGTHVWTLTFLMSIVWIGIVIAGFTAVYGLGSFPQSLSPVQWIGLTALAIFPILIIILLGFSLRQMKVLSSQSHALGAAADALTQPDSTVVARSANIAAAIRTQVHAVDGELQAAMERLSSMELTLNTHTDALKSSHLAATQQTSDIAQRLSEERDGLRSISSSFDERMNALSRMMSEHGERLAQSTHMAEQKIQEARVSVEGAAAKINASSEIVRTNALQASEALATSETSISGLADNIKAQASTLDDINARHAAELAELVEQLSQEQAHMNSSIEARLDKMRDMSLSAKVSAESLADASDAGQRTVEALAKSASLADSAVKQRFADLEDMVNYSNAKAESISERAAKRVRDSLSLTRMEISRIESDMLELETHITNQTQNVRPRPGQDTAALAPVKPSKTGWRQSLLRFRPLDNDINITTIDVEDNDIVPSDNGVTLAQEAQIAPPAEPKEAVEIQVLEIDPVDTPTADDAASPPLDLDMTSDDSDMDIPDPNADLKQEAQQFISPIEPQLRTDRKAASKKGWSWRNMLRGMDADVPPPMTGASSAGNTTETIDVAQQTRSIISSLTAIGLSPNAIVDDGCIIEAVNTRKSKGPKAMREVITLRLSEPVAHLSRKLDEDAVLKSETQQFATRYFQSLYDYENDREALREQLESEAGRAFVLCDAALG